MNAMYYVGVGMGYELAMRREPNQIRVEMTDLMKIEGAL